MLSIRSVRNNSNHANDLNQLLAAIEAATEDTNLLALNMALEGAHAGIGSAAQLADAVGELSIRANQFSHRVRVACWGAAPSWIRATWLSSTGSRGEWQS
jgi:methyl-accepting chemotaxis protein